MATKTIKAWIDGAIQEIEVEDIELFEYPLSPEERLDILEDKPIITDGNFLVGNGTEDLEEMTPEEVLSHINGASVMTVTTAEYEALNDDESNANILYALTDDDRIILTENVNYGTEYPAEAIEGQLFLVEDTPPADYIVSQGITDGWTWRKWNSGVAECWDMPTVQSGAWTSIGTSGLHYTASPRSISLPQNLFNSIRSANVNVSSAAGAVVSPMTCSCSTSGLNIHFLRVLGGTNDIKLYLSIRVMGSWK